MENINITPGKQAMVIVLTRHLSSMLRGLFVQRLITQGLVKHGQ